MISAVSINNRAVPNRTRPNQNSQSVFRGIKTNTSEEYGRFSLPELEHSSMLTHDVVGSIRETIDFSTSQFLLEDIESILEEPVVLATSKSDESGTAQTDDIQQYLPNAIRNENDLRAFMNKREKQKLVPSSPFHRSRGTAAMMPYGRLNSKKLMEDYLEEGLALILEETVGISPSMPLCSSNEDHSYNISAPLVSSILVWTIHPLIRDGKVRFRFSTDLGGRIVLKKKDSLEFVEILRDASTGTFASGHNCKIFYQIYTIDSRESYVVDGKTAGSLIEDLSSRMLSSAPRNSSSWNTRGMRNKTNASKSDDIPRKVSNHFKLDAVGSSRTIDPYLKHARYIRQGCRQSWKRSRMKRLVLKQTANVLIRAKMQSMGNQPSAPKSLWRGYSLLKLVCKKKGRPRGN